MKFKVTNFRNHNHYSAQPKMQYINLDLYICVCKDVAHNGVCTFKRINKCSHLKFKNIILYRVMSLAIPVSKIHLCHG